MISCLISQGQDTIWVGKQNNGCQFLIKRLFLYYYIITRDISKHFIAINQKIELNILENVSVGGFRDII